MTTDYVLRARQSLEAQRHGLQIAAVSYQRIAAAFYASSVHYLTMIDNYPTAPHQKRTGWRRLAMKDRALSAKMYDAAYYTLNLLSKLPPKEI